MGTYLALHRAHVPVDFVDIEQLKKGWVNRYHVLYAPYSYAIDDRAVAALRDFVSRGGTLWADGLTAWKNEIGEFRPTIPGGLTDVFGFEASDIYPVKIELGRYGIGGGQLPRQLRCYRSIHRQTRSPKP
jgi:Beta-galactosidase trimerisation domain